VALLRHTLQPLHTFSGITSSPRVEFAYALLDRFLLEGSVSCSETTTAHEVPLPMPVIIPLT
jgi:hypothetical protein